MFRIALLHGNEIILPECQQKISQRSKCLRWAIFFPTSLLIADCHPLSAEDIQDFLRESMDKVPASSDKLAINNRKSHVFFEMVSTVHA